MFGRVLGGRYTIQERIGGGGMSVVYRAFDAVLRRPVAVKVLRAEFVGETDIVRRFRHEAQAAASLQHANIVNVYDVGEEDADTYYIVMEYVPGHTLKEELRRRGPEPPERAAALCAEVLAALEEAHTHGIVHRDVKPQNVLLTKSGHAKVSDFGIARAAASATIVHTARALGTAHYASPEQVRGGATDERSDVYSVGCVLYEALTGQPPFAGDDALAVMWQHAQSEPPDPRALSPDVPAALVAVVHRALAKRPEDRYPSAAAMLADLRLAAGVPLPGHEIEMGPPAGGDAQSAPARTGRSGDAGGHDASSGATGGGDPARQRAGGGNGAGQGAGQGYEVAGAVANTPRVPQPARATLTDRLAPVAAASEGTLDLRALGQAPWRDGGAAADQRQAAARPGATAARHPTARRRRAARWLAVVLAVALLAVGGYYALNRVLTVPTVRVPDILGRSTSKAVALLDGAGLRPDVSATLPSANVAPGDVVASQPAPGSAVKQGRTVRLTISTGPALITGGVPDLTGLYTAAAVSMLRSIGLVPKTSPQYSDTTPQGQVIGSDPPAGAAARQGDVVTVQVSEGPAPQRVAMPALIGQRLGDAEATLKTLDLQTGTITQTKSGYPAGYVVATNPTKGTHLSPGQTVNLTVSSGCQSSASLHLSVPDTLPPPVQVLVVVTDQMPSPHPVYQHQAVPGAVLTVDACWLGAAARWSAYANGNVFATGILSASGTH